MDEVLAGFWAKACGACLCGAAVLHGPYLDGRGFKVADTGLATMTRRPRKLGRRVPSARITLPRGRLRR